jgi:hypothetical protein
MEKTLYGSRVGGKIDDACVAFGFLSGSAENRKRFEDMLSPSKALMSTGWVHVDIWLRLPDGGWLGN